MGDAGPLSIPGKVFLLGEYAVLAGLPAWVAAVGPRFTFEPGSSVANFHRESPAGKFLSSEASARVNGNFSDPWKGLGGFGASTAEFAVVAHSLGLRDPLEVFDRYQKLHEDLPLPPSGADLLAQWVGGVIEWNPSIRVLRDITKEVGGVPVLVFSATHLENRKTKTHSHLEALGGFDRNRETFFAKLRENLAPSLFRATEGLREQNFFEVGHSFTQFANALSALGLEASFVRQEREALARIPGVLGVKGCGALQTDAMLVMVDSLENGRRVGAIIEYAEREFGLRLVSKGLKKEVGIS